MDVNDAVVDAVADEMCANIDVLHARMGVGVVCACDGSKIVAVE